MDKPAIADRASRWRGPWMNGQIWLVLLLMVLSGNASGQAKKQDLAPVMGKTWSERDLREKGLEPTPLSVEALGLTIHLPTGSLASAQKIEGKFAVSISDGDQANTWTMRIQPMTSTLPRPSAEGQIEEHLAHLRVTKQPYDVLRNEQVNYGGVDGRLCWVQKKSESGQSYVSGWLILPTGERTFLVFAMQTLPEHLSRLQPMFVASFATIQLRSVEELEAEKKTRLDAAAAFLDSLKPDRLKSLAGLSQWTRIYVPASAASPAAERGYSLVEVLDGKKGALNPERAEKDYTGDDRRPGLLVRIKGRVVINPQSNDVYDTIALYWMAWDQSEEAWSIRGTRRQGEAEQTEAETGVRTAATPGTMPRISVIKAESGTNVREPAEWPVPEVYLSQALSWLLGPMLPRDSTGPRQFSWYFFHRSSDKTQITQRQDVWEPLSDGSGNFKLTTKLTSDTPPIVSIYGKDGMLVRRTHPDGSVTEPCTVDDLQRLWKTKPAKSKTPR